jgi:hypothetical protein
VPSGFEDATNGGNLHNWLEQQRRAGVSYCPPLSDPFSLAVPKGLLYCLTNLLSLPEAGQGRLTQDAAANKHATAIDRLVLVQLRDLHLARTLTGRSLVARAIGRSRSSDFLVGADRLDDDAVALDALGLDELAV